MTEHWINTIHLYLQHHPHSGLLFAFGVAFLESLPILGTIMPGAITMTVVGWMIGSQLLPALLTLSLTSIGALMGDVLGFALGDIYRDRIQRIWPLSRVPILIEKSKVFVAKHGGKSIFIGRFVGPARSTVPLVAGALQLSWPRFLVAAIPTSVLWSILYCLPGIILGAFATEVPPQLLTAYLAIGAGIILAGWGLIWLIQRFFTEIQAAYHDRIDSYWAFLSTHRGSRLVTRFIQNRQHPTSHHQLSRLLLALVSWSVFLIIAWHVLSGSALNQINQPIFHLTQSLRTHALDTLFTVLTCLGKSYAMLLFAMAVSLLLLISKQYRAGTCLALGALFTTAIAFACKHIHFNPRPSGFMLVHTTSSFPSAHTAISTTVLCLLAFYTSTCLRAYRLTIYTVSWTLILLIAFSRLYLGAHWFLDVMAGLFLGHAVALSTVIVYQRLPRPSSPLSIPTWRWLMSVFFCFIAINGLYLATHFQTVQFETTPFHSKQQLSSHQWWHHPLKYTPTYRLNRLGQPIEPLNVQLAARLDAVNAMLHAHQWTLVTRQHHFTDTIYRLTKRDPQYHLPLFERLYQNQRPTLVAYHAASDKNQIFLLRLWNTHLQLTPQHVPVWIGMLNEMRAPPFRIAIPHGRLTYFRPVTTIMPLLHTPTWQTKIITVSTHQPSLIQHTPWDYRIVLMRQPIKHH